MFKGPLGFLDSVLRKRMGAGETHGPVPPLDYATLCDAVMAPDPGWGFRAWLDSGELGAVMPELVECNAIPGRDRRTTVLGHSVRVCGAVRPELYLRLAGLLHDIGKPRTRVVSGGKVAYPEHAEIGADMAHGLLLRMGASGPLADRVASLVRYHMFQLQPFHSDKAIRRWIRTVGSGNALDLLELRRADIVGTSDAYWMAWGALSLLARRVGEQLEAEGEPAGLPIDGNDVMGIYGIPQGPEVGLALKAIAIAVHRLGHVPDREALLAMMRDPGDPLLIRGMLGKE